MSAEITQFPRRKFIPVEALNFRMALQQAETDAQKLVNYYLDHKNQPRADYYARLKAEISLKIREQENYEGIV